MKPSFHHDRFRHTVDAEHREIFLKGLEVGRTPDIDRKIDPSQAPEELREGNINQPSVAVDAGRIAQVEANQRARKEETAVRMAHADLATLQRLANPDNNRLISTERSMEHTAAKQELQNRGEELPVGTAKPKAVSKQQNAPQQDTVQLEADAQASILDDGKGGLVDWSALTPEERTTRTNDAQARFGVSVDPDTGVVKAHQDVTETKLNRLGGALGKIATGLGKWMEKFSGLMATISGQPVVKNAAPVAPTNAAEARVKAKLARTDEPALRTDLNTEKTAAEADIQQCNNDMANAAIVDKGPVKTRLDVAVKKRDEAAADLAALDALVKTADKFVKAIDDKLTVAKTLMIKLKTDHKTLGFLPEMKFITAERTQNAEVSFGFSDGSYTPTEFHDELLKVTGKQGDTSLEMDAWTGAIKNPSAYFALLNDVIAKAKKAQP